MMFIVVPHPAKVLPVLKANEDGCSLAIVYSSPAVRFHKLPGVSQVAIESASSWTEDSQNFSDVLNELSGKEFGSVTAGRDSKGQTKYLLTRPQDYWAILLINGAASQILIATPLYLGSHPESLGGECRAILESWKKEFPVISAPIFRVGD
jgi:hypothetical protein